MRRKPSSRANTYVDKTFAPDSNTAEEMFEFGKRYGTKFFSTSALRYAKELGEIKAKRDTGRYIEL